MFRLERSTGITQAWRMTSAREQPRLMELRVRRSRARRARGSPVRKALESLDKKERGSPARRALESPDKKAQGSLVKKAQGSLDKKERGSPAVAQGHSSKACASSRTSR